MWEIIEELYIPCLPVSISLSFSLLVGGSLLVVRGVEDIQAWVYVFVTVNGFHSNTWVWTNEGIIKNPSKIGSPIKIQKQFYY